MVLLKLILLFSILVEATAQPVGWTDPVNDAANIPLIYAGQGEFQALDDTAYTEYRIDNDVNTNADLVSWNGGTNDVVGTTVAVPDYTPSASPATNNKVVSNDVQGCHDYCTATFGSAGIASGTNSLYEDLVGFSFEDQGDADATNNFCICWRQADLVTPTIKETDGGVAGDNTHGYTWCFNCHSSQPSGAPSSQPSSEPSSSPSDQPSSVPSSSPSQDPSSLPSEAPSGVPSSSPSEQPSSVPSHGPSAIPSNSPSEVPSSQPSEHPTSQPSGEPSAMPSCTPSSAPTDADTMCLFYPDWSPGGEGCLNDCKQPNYMSANPRDYLHSTLSSCCTTYFGWNYDTCMGNLRGVCSRALFYPDWTGANEGCIDDGNEPAYMTDNAISYLFSQLEDCCSEHYQWNYDTCVGRASTANNGLYYPDFDSTDHVCRNNGKQPPYMNNSPDAWMHSTLAECCSTNYRWNYDNCIGSGGAATPATSPGAGLYYPNWSGSSHVCLNDGGQPAYMTSNPSLWMHTTLESCCKQNYSWNYDPCIGSSGGTPTNKWFMDYTGAGKCILDGGPQGSAEAWNWLYDTQKECCDDKNWWNDDCED